MPLQLTVSRGIRMYGLETFLRKCRGLFCCSVYYYLYTHLCNLMSFYAVASILLFPTSFQKIRLYSHILVLKADSHLVSTEHHRKMLFLKSDRKHIEVTAKDNIKYFSCKPSSASPS